MYGKIVYLYTDNQALRQLIKRKPAYRQNNSRLTRRLDIVAHFDISIKYTAGKNLKLTDYLSSHPKEESWTGDSYEEEYVIEILSEIFKKNHKDCQLLNMDRKTLTTDQSLNVAVTAN